jgi:hypothetical protein
MNNFDTSHNSDVIPYTWYIDRTGDMYINHNTNDDILYNVFQSYSDDNNIIDNIDNIDNIDTHNIDIMNDYLFTNYDYNFHYSINNIQRNIRFVFEDCHITEDDKNCPICMETKQPSDICRLNCKHTFCHHCIFQYIERNQQYSTCPLCRHLISSLHIHT